MTTAKRQTGSAALFLATMRGQSPLLTASRGARAWVAPGYICRQCRFIQISALPASESPKLGADAFGAPIDGARDSAGKAARCMSGLRVPLLTLPLKMPDSRS